MRSHTKSANRCPSTDRRLRAAIFVAVATLLASCGTRLPDSAFEARSDARGATGTPTGEVTDEFDGAITATTLAGLGDGTTRPGGSTEPSPNSPRAGQADDAPNKASDVGVTETTITLGNIVAENGVLGDAFAPAVRGLRAWVAATNARGGIRGRKIVLKTCDDREDRNRDLQCAQQLVERDKVFALVATNSRALGGSAQYLADREIPVLGMPITNSFYRYPTFFSIYRTGVARDGKTVGYKGNLVNTSSQFRWFRQNLNVSKGAVFSYDIDESKQAGVLFKKGMELEGFKVTSYTVSFAAPSFDQAVADMQQQGIDFIVDTMDDGANRKLCDAMERRRFSVKAKVSTIVVMGDRLGAEYNDTCRNSVYVNGFTLSYDQTSVPEIARFRDAYRKYQPNLPLHQWALEAWVLGNLTASYIDTSAPTRKGFVAYLNGVREYTSNGVHAGLDWGKYDPSSSRVRECFTISRWQDSAKGWTNASGAFPTCYPDAHQYQVPALEQGN